MTQAFQVAAAKIEAKKMWSKASSIQDWGWKQAGKIEEAAKQQEKELEKAKFGTHGLQQLPGQSCWISAEQLKNSQFFRPNLSEDAKLVMKASAGIGVCSRCGWSSGCLSCSAEKALQHFRKVEAAKVQKVPKISGLWFGSGKILVHGWFSAYFFSFLSCLSGLSAPPLLPVQSCVHKGFK